MVQLSAIVSAQVYRTDDAPRCTYPISYDRNDTYEKTLDLRGNRNLIIICTVNVAILYPGTKAYYKWRNRQRAKVWDAMTSEVCCLLSAS